MHKGIRIATKMFSLLLLLFPHTHTVLLTSFHPISVWLALKTMNFPQHALYSSNEVKYNSFRVMLTYRSIYTISIVVIWFSFHCMYTDLHGYYTTLETIYEKSFWTTTFTFVFNATYYYFYPYPLVDSV